MGKFSPEQIAELNEKLRTPQEVLKWALDNLHPKLALASSFGAEDVVVIDMLAKVNQNARIFTLDTGRLNQETYDVMDEIRKKYNINIEVTFPEAEEVIEMVRTNGMNLFYESAVFSLSKENVSSTCKIAIPIPCGFCSNISPASLIF